MQIPETLKVGSHTWKVRLVSQQELGDSTDGDYNTETMEIRIHEGLPVPMQELTFFHELLHVLNGELDHNMVEMLSAGVYHVLKENKLI